MWVSLHTWQKLATGEENGGTGSWDGAVVVRRRLLQATMDGSSANNYGRRQDGGGGRDVASTCTTSAAGGCTTALHISGRHISGSMSPVSVRDGRDIVAESTTGY